MLKFRKDRWLGNKWASIDLDPIDAAYFLRLLAHLSRWYSFPMPPVMDTIDGYVADFEILGSEASIHLDTWNFSVAFEVEAVRDRVIEELQGLPVGYFETN